MTRRFSSGGSDAAAEIEMAERLDAAGRHHEAIDCLARATQLGSVEAKTRLAKRVIVGDRAPLLLSAGVDLIREAAAEGGAEAAAILAVLAAAGLGGRQNWAAALDLARVAAARGWQRAARQLEVLASLDPRLEGHSWVQVAPPIILHDDPSIRLFRNFVNDEVCAWLIESARGRLERAKVYDAASKADLISEGRTNSAATFNLVETDLVHLMVQSRMSAAIGVPFANMEGATVLHYAPGEQITEHYDFVDPSIPGYEDEVRTRGERIATFLVYLNEDYEGGETEFSVLGIRHKGRRGEGLCFINALRDGAPDRRTRHAGRPPVRGEKWVLSQFIRNKPAVPFLAG
ncbi:MAG: 2OG-Fe(II) oxygenase [Gammaproteobacteria bacterium]